MKMSLSFNTDGNPNHSVNLLAKCKENIIRSSQVVAKGQTGLPAYPITPNGPFLTLVVVYSIPFQSVIHFNFGIVSSEELECLQVLTGTVPFQILSCSQMAYTIGKLGGIPVIPPDLPVGVKRLLKKCLKSKPSQRPSMSSIVKVSPESQRIDQMIMALIVISKS
jgi:serine/threonine protein kinase